jgi:penicillin-binding protein 2
MRTKFIISIFLIIWLSLLVRIFYLSIQSNNYYELLSEKNSIKTKLIAPVRGEILDRNFEPIAINKLGFKIQLRPHLRSKDDMKILEKEISVITSLLPNLNGEKLLEIYKKQNSYYNHDYIDIVDFISYDDIMPVYTQLNLRENINIVSAPERYYPNGMIAAHVIGYVAKANQKDIDKDPILKLIGNVGRSGAESYYNKFLEGKVGERIIKVSARNEHIEEMEYRPPLEDNQLILGIDMRLQKDIAEEFKDKVGAVVVMDVNGTIIAAGSYPEYDLNDFVSGISHDAWDNLINNADKPFTNKFIKGLYPPGSTIKTGSGLIYITTELNEWWSVYCTGSVAVGDRDFRCWKDKGHGSVEVVKAVRESCDDYFYKGSLRLGIDRLSEGLKRYGLGVETGIDLPHEFVGTVPSRTWKRERYNRPWYIGETLNTSIGQGDFLSTPMQITRYTALMATGKLVTPHVAIKIGDKVVEPKFDDVLTDLEKSKLPLIQKGMYEVCNVPGGTGVNYVRTPVKIAGKTGTAQVVAIEKNIKKRINEHDMEYYQRSHAWFTTYGPYDNPKYIVTVLIEHGGHGGAATGSIINKIYSKLYEYGYITN